MACDSRTSGHFVNRVRAIFLFLTCIVAITLLVSTRTVSPRIIFTPIKALERNSTNASKKAGLNLPPFLTTNRDNKNETRMQFVKEMMEQAWSSYVKYAWGHDDLLPLTQQPFDWYGDQNILLNTPIDALDTLYIMGLHDEYADAKALALTLNFSNVTATISLFETIIRVVGGLLAAYDLEGDERVLRKCVELVDLLLPAFDTPTGFPANEYRLSDGWKSSRADLGLAEIGTLQLEFQYLSDVTGNPLYAEKALWIYEQMAKIPLPVPGLFPEKLSKNVLLTLNNKVSLGGMSDSYYEYLLKMWLSTGEEKYYKMYTVAADNFARYMRKYTNDGFLYMPAAQIYRNSPFEEPTVNFEGTWDHLACFAGGMFATGGLASRRGAWTTHLDMGSQITEYCWEMYAHTSTGIGPENVRGDNIQAVDRQYHLRPEAVESLFYMWRYTHNEIYRERAWVIVQALEKYCSGESGFHGLNNVNNPGQGGVDRQESFFLAETLKYLYLIFADDDTIALEKYVFNTEAHVLSVRGHGRRNDSSKFVPLPFV
ncbi:glycoside hydrolase [Chytriomyces sp. MP71]|nr:glycoside hydrolase [Chytriomyces sp. MP71]